MPSRLLIAVSTAAALCAQAPRAASSDAAARKALQQVMDAVGNGWFGKPYQPFNAVNLHGTLSISLTPQALGAKLDELSHGKVKGELTKGATVNLRLAGTYFANSDFRTELAGDFGNLLYTRIGNRGFLYSKELNAYTTKVAPPAPDAPLSFLGWFRQVLNEIQTVYVDQRTFKATLGREESAGGRALQTVTFIAPTASYNPKKREQSMAESLGFWKRGRLDMTFDKTSRLPQRMSFLNEVQGISTRMAFSYGRDGRLQSVSIDNQSRGTQGPASLSLTHDEAGLIDHVHGTLNSQRQNVAFDIHLEWQKGKKASSIISVPPPGANKKGGDELKTLLAVGLAGRILDLQRQGLNLRSITLSN
ncbi:MAG TPA: hypothetical protein PKM35_13205 [Holophaga sp.]|nr:hypothetical protein [Holophaga sp.]HPS68084.1 hypothetical protein [Holophaga sp.]